MAFHFSIHVVLIKEVYYYQLNSHHTRYITITQIYYYREFFFFFLLEVVHLLSFGFGGTMFRKSLQK